MRTRTFILGKMQRYDALIALVLSGCTVTRELAALAVAGASPSTEPSVPVFSRLVVEGELEDLYSAGLDSEAAAHTSAQI